MLDGGDRGRPGRAGHGRARLVLGLALSVLVALAALAGAWWADRAEHRRAADRAAETARRASMVLRRELDRSCEGAEAVAAFMGDRRGVTGPEFRRFAGRIMRTRALRMVAFAPRAEGGSPSRFTVPEGAPAGLLGAVGPAAAAAGAAAPGRVEMGAPTRLAPDGAPGVLITVPVAAGAPGGGARAGVVVAAVPFSALAHALGPVLGEGVRVQVTDRGHPLLPGAPPPGDAERRAVRVGGQTWVAWAWGGERHGHALPVAVGSLGLVAAGLLGAVVLAGGRRERRVGESLSLRTRELAEREAQITAMALSAQDGLAICAADGTILRINERFAEVVGHRRAAVVGARPPHPWWLPADAAPLAAALADAGRGRRGELECRIRRADGEERWIRLAYAPAGSGGHVETLTDVTERRRGEDAERAQREIATLIARGADAGEVFAAAARATRRLFATRAALVVRFEPGATARVAGWDAEPGVAPAPDAAMPLEPSGTAIAGVHRTGRPARSHGYDPSAGELDRIAAERGAAGVAVPVRVEGRLWGAIGVATGPDAHLPADTEDRLGRFADLIGVAIAQAEAHAALEARAMTDNLTGMPNHRAFHERLGAEVAGARRSATGAHGLCLAVLDVDGLGAANDVHGHEAGDALLREVAGVLRAQQRPGDLMARVGGDEFGWLLPATSLDEAAGVVDRARAAVAHRRFPAAGWLRLSAGVASLAQAGGDGRRLTQLADGALYWAKVEGRDRVVAYDPRRVREHSPEERAERIRREQGLAALRALARVVDAKDPDTREHSERVAELAATLARALGWADADARRLHEAALVHDVGKIGVPDVILFKPGALTPDEMDQVRRHAAIGGDIAGEVLDAEQAAWVRGHHERYDGDGYPDGLAAGGIPPGARVLAVADAFDVMVSVRTYKAARSWEDALAEACRCAGGQFDPEVVQALRRLWTAGVIAPPGGTGR